jgi:hypothetical protein
MSSGWNLSIHGALPERSTAPVSTEGVLVFIPFRASPPMSFRPSADVTTFEARTGVEGVRGVVTSRHACIVVFRRHTERESLGHQRLRVATAR